MNTYIVRRRAIAASANGLDAALARLRSFEEGAVAGQGPRWLMSYALREADGGFGLACLFLADAAAVLSDHAHAVRLPAEEILRVTANRVALAFAPSSVVLVRRRAAWGDESGFHRAMAGAGSVADAALERRVAWLRSHAVREDDGRVGSVCLLQCADRPALAEHARRAGLPCGEVTSVLGRIVFRADPCEPAAPSGVRASRHRPAPHPSTDSHTERSLTARSATARPFPLLRASFCKDQTP